MIQKVIYHLFNDSKGYISSKLCSIYAIEIENFIRGFISLSASMIRIKDKHFSILGEKIEDLQGIGLPIPSILIGKLLIDQELRGSGLGGKLIAFSLSTAYELSKTIGIRFVIVDSNKNSVGFYEKSGFIIIDEKENTTTMVFDLKAFDEL